MGEMVWLAQVAKEASLGNEPLARNIRGPLIRDLVSTCGVWHSAAVVV